MKILLLTSEFLPFRGGIGTYARELAGAATKAGHQVVVAAPDYGADQSAADAVLPYRVVRFPGAVPSMRGLPRRIMVARRLAAAERFDVVHAADWPFFIPARLLPRRTAPRRLLTLHGTEVIYMQHARRRRLLDLIGFWRRGWARWVANSRYTRDLALAAFPLAPEDVAAVPLGVADDWRAGRADRTEARASLGLGDEAVIVSLGRVVPRKGHAVLAEALALLPPALAARARWWVIGPSVDGEHAEALRARAATLPVATEFLGMLPDDEVRRRLSAADLFCLPGYQDEEGRVEGFGLVFLEAGAYGVPSVATRSGGIPEAVEDGVTGLLVPERDALALARALERLIADEPLRLRMAAAAEARAAAATWHCVMEDTYEPVTAARDD